MTTSINSKAVLITEKYAKQKEKKKGKQIMDEQTDKVSYIADIQ